MSPCRLIFLFFCLLLTCGHAVAAVATNDLEGTWRGTMTSQTANPIYFTCNASGTITNGQETLSDGSTVQVSGNLTVGANGAVNGTMIFTFPGQGSVQATTRTVTLTVTDDQQLLLAGPLNAPYQNNGTDVLRVIRDEPYIPPVPDVALARGGNDINRNSTDVFPFIGVAGDPEVLTYIVTNTGRATLNVSTVTSPNRANCTFAVNTAPAGSITAGNSSPLVLAITPTAAGAWSCVVSFENNDPDEDPFTWTITGSATQHPAPEIRIQRAGTTITNGTDESVGSVRLGQDLALPYVVTNLGSATLEIGPLSLSNFSNCTVNSNLPNVTAISARNTQTVTLTISPAVAGHWSFDVTIPSDDDTEPTTSWSVSGTAREEITLNNQKPCGIGGGFALLMLAGGLAGLSFFASRSHARKPFSMVRTTPIAALLLSASGMSAVEWNAGPYWDNSDSYDPWRVNDWRFSYTMLPTRADISFLDKSDGGFNPTYNLETNWDQAGRTGLMWMTPLSGLSEFGDFILGLELSTNRCVLEEDNSNPEIDFRSYQVTLHPGIGVLLDDNFHIEINPFVSVGYAQYDHSDLGDSNDIYTDWGVRLASYYTWRSGFQLGLQTGYIDGIMKGELKGSGTNYEVDIRFRGLFLGLQLGYRL